MLPGRREDDRVACAMTCNCAVEERGNGHELQRLAGGAGNVGQPAARPARFLSPGLEQVGGKGIGAHSCSQNVRQWLSCSKACAAR